MTPALVPVHFCSGTRPFAGLQIVALLSTTSAGQSAAVPLHCSVTSQSPALSRQTALLGRKLNLQMMPVVLRQYDVVELVQAASGVPAAGRAAAAAAGTPSTICHRRAAVKHCLQENPLE
jgi:hypothetical protein